MATQNISLRISGTKVRKGGFAPLVTVGVLPAAENDKLDRSVSDNERPGFIVRHTPGYIIYNAVDCNVRSADADAPGTLSIAVTIPADKQLSEGRSPYDLLMELYNYYKSNYMTPLSDGRDSFVNTDADPEPFRGILGRYQLEDRKGRYVVMNPAAPAGRMRAAGVQMSELLRDSQYPEFANFREIEIGVTGNSTPALDRLPIPRRVVYALRINGVVKSQVSDTSEPIIARALPNDKFEYIPVTFTIDELIASGGKLNREGALVTLNPNTETISCDLDSRPIKYNVVINNPTSDTESVSMMKQWMGNGEIKITHNGVDRTKEILDGKCTVTPIESNKEFKCDKVYKGYVITITQKIDRENRRVYLSFSLKRAPVELPGGNQAVPGGQPRRVDGGGYQPPRNPGNNHGGNVRGHGNDLGGYSGYADNRHNQERVQQTAESGKKEERNRAFFFGILIGFILGMGCLYLINEFLLKDAPSATELAEQNGIGSGVEAANSDREGADRKPVENPDSDKEGEQPEEVKEGATGVETGASEKSTLIVAPSGAAAPTCEDLKPQLLNAYNNNRWGNCKRVMNQNEALKDAYWNDIEHIIKIRQNKAFDKGGNAFRDTISTDQITMLEVNGYIKDNRPTDKFKVTSLDSIKTLRKNLEDTMSGI